MPYTIWLDINRLLPHLAITLIIIAPIKCCAWWAHLLKQPLQHIIDVCCRLKCRTAECPRNWVQLANGNYKWLLIKFVSIATLQSTWSSFSNQKYLGANSLLMKLNWYWPMLKDSIKPNEFEIGEGVQQQTEMQISVCLVEISSREQVLT